MHAISYVSLFSRSVASSKKVEQLRYPPFDLKEVPFPSGLEEFVFEAPLQVPITFVLTSEDGRTLFAASLSFLDMSTGELKAVCLLSQLPMVSFLTRLVWNVVEQRDNSYFPRKLASLRETVSLPIEGIVEFDLFENSKVMRIEIPLANELPLLDVPLSVVVRRLSLPTLLSVFEAILLEKSVVVLSHETSELTPFCLAVLCLIYPFHFQHVFIPLLPPNAHGVLQAPVPYLCGLSPNSLESHSLPAHAIILDVDKDTVDGPEQLPRLPDQERHKLKVKLKELYYNEDKGRGTISYRGFNESVLFHQENRYPLCKDIDRMFAVPVGEIRASFLRFFLSLFRNYKRYLSGQ